MASRKRSRVYWALGIAAAAFGVVGALHLPAGRSMLAAAGGCPMGKTPSAERLESFRQQQNVATLKGTRKASARPAYGFSLDESTKADVLAWASAGSHACKEELNGAALRCEGIGQGSGTVRDAFFRFDPKSVLVGIDLMHEGATPEQAVALVDSLAGAVAREAGPPSAVQGQISAAHLGEGYLSRAATEFRFVDYAADISATNFGEQGIVVRQQYRSVPRT